MISKIFGGIFRYRRAVLLAYAILIPVAVYFGSKTRLDANILNLLPKDLPEVKSIRKLERWASMGWVIVGLVRDSKATPDDLKRFADAAAARLASSQWNASKVAAGTDISKLKRALPLFLDPADLEEIGRRVLAFVKAEQKRKSGFYESFEDETAAPKLSFDDLLPKYRQRFQWDALGADPALQGATPAPGAGWHGVVAGLRSTLNRDNSRLYVLSPDGEMLVFIFKPTFSPDHLEHYPDLEHDIQAAVDGARKDVPAAAATQVFVGGTFSEQRDTRDTTLQDSYRSSLWATLLVLAIAFVVLRRVRALLLVLVSLASGLALAFGIAFLAIGTVNVLTAFLVPILSGFGIDFGFYLATRFHLYERAGLKRDDALREAWMETANPSAMAALTTLAVLALLAFGRFRGFAEMGIILCIGITTVWIAMYTLLPVLFLYLHPAGGENRVSLETARGIVARGAVTAAARWYDRFTPAGKAAPYVVAAALAITVWMGWSARNVRFAYTGEELTIPDQPSLFVDKLIMKHFNEFVDHTIVFSDTEEHARKVQAYFQEHYGTFRTIGRYKSVFSYLPDAAQSDEAIARMAPLRAALKRLPKKDADPDVQFLLTEAQGFASPRKIGMDELPQEIQNYYVARDANGKVLGFMGGIVAKEWLWDVDLLRAFVHEVDSIRVDGKPLEVTGRPHIFTRVIEIVQHEALLFSLVGVCLKLLLLWAQMRSLKFAMLALVPLFVEMVWLLGCLPLIGEKGLSLSFMNLVVVPILVGLGVAYGVHVIYNYRIYGTARGAQRVTFRPVLGSALATLVGWAALFTASMIGLRGMAWIATLGMAFVTIVSLGVLPALVEVLHRAGWIRPDMVHESTSLEAIVQGPIPEPV